MPALETPERDEVSLQMVVMLGAFVSAYNGDVPALRAALVTGGHPALFVEACDRIAEYLEVLGPDIRQRISTPDLNGSKL